MYASKGERDQEFEDPPPEGEVAEGRRGLPLNPDDVRASFRAEAPSPASRELPLRGSIKLHQPAAFLRRADEAGEQRVRVERAALQLRVELDANEPGMVRRSRSPAAGRPAKGR